MSSSTAGLGASLAERGITSRGVGGEGYALQYEEQARRAWKHAARRKLRRWLEDSVCVGRLIAVAAVGVVQAVAALV
jgi:hypothetical protein